MAKYNAANVLDILFDEQGKASDDELSEEENLSDNLDVSSKSSFNSSKTSNENSDTSFSDSPKASSSRKKIEPLNVTLPKRIPRFPITAINGLKAKINKTFNKRLKKVDSSVTKKKTAGNRKKKIQTTKKLSKKKVKVNYDKETDEAYISK